MSQFLIYNYDKPKFKQIRCKENNLTNKAVLNHTRHANATSQKPYLHETDANNSTLQETLIRKIESAERSDFRDLKRKYDDLENEFEKERAEKKRWCNIM